MHGAVRHSRNNQMPEKAVLCRRRLPVRNVIPPFWARNRVRLAPSHSFADNTLECLLSVACAAKLRDIPALDKHSKVLLRKGESILQTKAHAVFRRDIQSLRPAEKKPGGGRPDFGNHNQPDEQLKADSIPNRHTAKIADQALEAAMAENIC